MEKKASQLSIGEVRTYMVAQKIPEKQIKSQKIDFNWINIGAMGRRCFHSCPSQDLSVQLQYGFAN